MPSSRWSASCPFPQPKPTTPGTYAGAQDAAKTIGWNVSVIDAAGNADQANAAIQNFAQRGATAHRRHGVSLFLDRRRTRCGQERQDSRRDLGRRAGRRGRRHQRLGRPDGRSGQRSHDQDDERQRLGSRAHLSHRRSMPEPRGRARQGARRSSRHQGHQERSPHSRLFRGRRPIRQRLARLASAPARRTSPSGDAGTIPRSARSARSGRKIATT